jgi:hypothetical protein
MPDEAAMPDDAAMPEEVAMPDEGDTIPVDGFVIAVLIDSNDIELEELVVDSAAFGGLTVAVFGGLTVGGFGFVIGRMGRSLISGL